MIPDLAGLLVLEVPLQERLAGPGPAFLDEVRRTLSGVNVVIKARGDDPGEEDVVVGDGPLRIDGEARDSLDWQSTEGYAV